MNTPAENAPRHPWLAALLSLVLPGFGQLYNGQPNRALGLFLALLVIGLPVQAALILLAPPVLTVPGVVLITLVIVGLWLFGVIDAWREASRRTLYGTAAWQTVPVYSAVFLLAAFVLIPLMVDYVRQRQVQSFYIPSGSMGPSLMQGDLLFADMRYNCPGCASAVQRGDIAIFVYPDNRTQNFVKRIVGRPGDRIALVNGRVQIDGEFDDVIETEDASINMPERTVRPGHVFVLGDNRASSRDSRDFGDVPLSDVIARPRQLWFSRGEDGIRWNRIGRLVQNGD